MQRQPTFSREVLGFLISEIGYGQQVVAFYELIEQAFPITPHTSVRVLDFSKMARANDDDPGVREAIRERTERAAQGEGAMEQVDFKKIDMPDERYPMENRGWTFWMGYYKGADTLMVKWVE